MNSSWYSLTLGDILAACAIGGTFLALLFSLRMGPWRDQIVHTWLDNLLASLHVTIILYFLAMLLLLTYFGMQLVTSLLGSISVSVTFSGTGQVIERTVSLASRSTGVAVMGYFLALVATFLLVVIAIGLLTRSTAHRMKDTGITTDLGASTIAEAEANFPTA